MLVSLDNPQVENRHTYKSTKHGRDISATILAGGTTYATKRLLERHCERPILVPRILDEFRHPLSPDEVKALNQATSRILNASGLAQKGVRVINHNAPGVSYYENRVLRFLRDIPMPEFIRNRIPFNNEQYRLDSVAAGLNACFDTKMNAILVNQNRQHTGIMHELGHATNKNNSLLWGTIQKYGCKTSKILSAAIILFTLCTKQSEPKEDKELTKSQKAKNFIRKNSPMLVLASLLPKLAEEFRASKIGEQYSLHTLQSAGLKERVKRMNKLGFASYAVGALISVACAYVAREAKNAFSKTLNRKNQEQVSAKQIKNNLDIFNYINNVSSFDNKARYTQR